MTAKLKFKVMWYCEKIHIKNFLLERTTFILHWHSWTVHKEILSFTDMVCVKIEFLLWMEMEENLILL